MAVNRVLTNSEKEILQNNARFLSECLWAIKNFASFWADNTNVGDKINQAGVGGGDGYVIWAKNRFYSAQVIFRGEPVEDRIPQEFCILLKGMNLWDSAITPFNPDTAIDYMVSASKFDELVVSYVKLKTQTTLF